MILQSSGMTTPCDSDPCCSYKHPPCLLPNKWELNCLLLFLHMNFVSWGLSEGLTDTSLRLAIAHMSGPHACARPRQPASGTQQVGGVYRFLTRPSFPESSTNVSGDVHHPWADAGLSKDTQRRLLLSQNSVTARFEAQKLWDEGYGGAKVKVGVFDTGIRADHPHVKNIRWASVTDSSVDIVIYWRAVMDVLLRGKDQRRPTLPCSRQHRANTTK